MLLTLDRFLVVAALLLLAAIGWLYLVLWPMPMPDGAGAATVSYAALTVIMWFLMMIAMMAPAVTPVVLLFNRVSQQAPAPLARTVSFIGGYFCAWLAFSVLVSCLQIGFIEVRWIDTMGVTRHDVVSAVLLLAVGAYQWLPLKTACLDHCRTPLHFLTRNYRPGFSGAWRMGLGHGVYCIGCCWLLMLLLFVGGVMNLWWVAGITALVASEKLLPQGQVVARVAGVLLAATAVSMLIGDISLR